LIVTNKFVEIAAVAAHISPSKDSFTTFSAFHAESKGLVQQKCLLVTFGGKSIKLGVFAFFVGDELSLAFLKNALDNELVVKILIGSADTDSRVLEDKFGVALGRERSHKVELTLR
jgi:hypothetical protein